MTTRWHDNYKPFHDVLERLTLPPRRPKGSLENYKRTQVVCAALHQEKVRRMNAKQRARHNPSKCGLCRMKVDTWTVQ